MTAHYPILTAATPPATLSFHQESFRTECLKSKVTGDNNLFNRVCLVIDQMFFLDVKPAMTSVEEAAIKQESQQQKPAREMSEEEKQMILMTEDFQRFFDQSSRIIERALSEHVDIFTDYTGASETDNNV